MNVDWGFSEAVISNIQLEGKNIIRPWGIETADSSAFFSLEPEVGYRYSVNSSNIQTSENSNSYDMKVNMPDGMWHLSGSDILDDNQIIRTCSLTCMEDTKLMDFVVRYRFRKSVFDYSIINGQQIYHNGDNIYHQYKTNHMKLIGPEFNVEIKVLDSVSPTELEPQMYVRDHPDEWTVHARMFPINWDKEIIKLCNSWAGTRPLPGQLTKLLLKSDSLREFLWYRNEKRPYKNRILRFINPNAFALPEITQGQELRWKISSEFEYNE